MSRRPRAVVPGVAHHVTQRGNNRQAVFTCDQNRLLYLRLLARHAARAGVRILGYCLMTNHVHLVAVPEREDSLARMLGPAHSGYALAWNSATESSGHLWQGRFFSCPLDQSHLITALRYVELNPVRAGLAARPWEWGWSSARAHVLGVPDLALDRDWRTWLPTWNSMDWRDMLSDPAEQDLAALRRATLTGEPIGGQGFLEDLERRIGRRLRVLDRGRPHSRPDTPAMGAGASLS